VFEELTFSSEMIEAMPPASRSRLMCVSAITGWGEDDGDDPAEEYGDGEDEGDRDEEVSAYNGPKQFRPV
jgi:hypothetical protein